MGTTIEKLRAAQKQAMENRPQVGGFPYVAETLRQAGVKRNTWTLPACQSVYFMENEAVVQLGRAMTEDMTQIPEFDEEALIRAIRSDQAGESTFPEFLHNVWNAGVLWYDVDLEKRNVMYGGAQGKIYRESYPEVMI